jgi:hypothetical protein
VTHFGECVHHLVVGLLVFLAHLLFLGGFGLLCSLLHRLGFFFRHRSNIYRPAHDSFKSAAGA